MDRPRKHATSICKGLDQDHDMLLHHVVDPGPFRFHSVSLPTFQR